MEERLKAGFTLTFGLTFDKKVRGGYLKSTDRGDYSLWIMWR